MKRKTRFLIVLALFIVSIYLANFYFFDWKNEHWYDYPNAMLIVITNIINGCWLWYEFGYVIGFLED
jgi:hypothetical protein